MTRAAAEMRLKGAVLVVAAIVAAVALAACGSSSDDDSGGGSTNGGASKEKVSFVLNFTPGPQHEEFVVADHKGFYDRAGLDVTTTTPAATTDPIKLVASGQSDIGIAYAGDVISAAAQGVPVESVATIHRHIPLGLLSKPDSGIRDPRDLIGKTVGLTPIPNNRAMFADFLRKQGIDPDDVKVVPVNFNGPQLVAAGKIDACDSVSWYENGVYEQLTGDRPSFMQFTDYGVPDGYFISLITSKRYLDSHRDTVRRFVGAVLDAEKWTIENPDAATRVLVDNVRDVTPEFARNSRAILRDVIVDRAAQQHGIGWADPAVLREQAQFYLDSGQIRRPVDVADIYTNDLLPAQPVVPDTGSN